jgi:hypothetical protein
MDDRFSFNLVCPKCKARRPVAVREGWLRKALANSLEFQVFGMVCGHIWTPSATEIDQLKNHPIFVLEAK